MKNSLAGVAGHCGLGRSKRSTKGRFAWVPALLLAVGVCLLMTTSPKTASDPVMSVQSGQGPASQGSMVSGSVSTFSGSYSTSVPVEVLPGRNGLQPAMALGYTSSNSNGLAGVGWGIPISSISRTGPGKGSPTYGSDDEFYMSLNGSGVQLMPLAPPAILGIADKYGTRHFRTRVESWSNVIAYYLLVPNYQGNLELSDQVVYWDIWSKSGEHYYFGPPPTADGQPADTDEEYSLTFKDKTWNERNWRNQWMLRKVEDVDGNSMDYTYCRGTAVPPAQTWIKKGLLPDEIRYGANTTAGYSHFAAVKFLYEEREDKTVSFRDGRRQDTGDRLQKILTGSWSGTGSLTEANALRRYEPVYSYSRTSGRSLLEEVKVICHEGTQTITKSVTFDYSTYSDQPMQWAEGSGAYSADNVLQGEDFSFGYYKYGSGQAEWGGAASTGSAMIDVNGDGLPDKVDYYKYEDVHLPSTNYSSKRIFLNPGPNGTTWTEVPNPSIPGEPLGRFRQNGLLEHNTVDMGVRFADVNADGMVDKIDCGSGIGTYRAIYLGRKDGKGWELNSSVSLVHLPSLMLNSAIAQLLPIDPPPDPGPGDNYATVTLHYSLPTVVSGGRMIFPWTASAESPTGATPSVKYYLQGKETAWSQTAAPGFHYAVYENLSPGSYIFKVRVTNGTGKQDIKDHPFTVVAPSQDKVPPEVTFTTVPEEGLVSVPLDFSWTGQDLGDGGSSGQTPLTFQYGFCSGGLGPSATYSGTSATVPRSSGAILVLATDGAGNMTLAEWAFSLTGLTVPVASVELSWGANSTLKSEPRGMVFVDLNGDGYPDILQCIWWNNGAVSRSAYLYNPSQLAWVQAPQLQWVNLIVPILKQDTDASWIDMGLRFADLNGDGLVDMFQCYHDPNKVVGHRLNNGHGWEPPNEGYIFNTFEGQPFSARSIVNSTVSVNQDRGAWLLDINGDGLPDKVDGWLGSDQDMTTTCSPPIEGDKQVYLNTGTNLKAVDSLAPFQPAGGAAPASNLPGYIFAEQFINTHAAGMPKTIASRDTGVRGVDLNGDGLVDFVRSYHFDYYNSSGTRTCGATRAYVQMSQPQDGNSRRFDYLTAVHNPLGGTTRIVYEPATGTFERSTPDNAKDFCPQIPYVVSTVLQEDGRGSVYMASYSYAHPKYDSEERQFVGFREVAVTGQDGVKTVTTYRQDFPFAGMVEQSRSFEALDREGTPGGTLFQESITTYESLVDEWGVWRVHKLKDLTRITENGHTLETGVVYGPYDEYDNLLTITTLGDTADPYGDKQVRTEYINKKDETNRQWLIGYVKQVDTFGHPPGGRAWIPTSSKQVYYDGSSTLGTIVEGHSTREDNWLDIRTDSGSRQTSPGYFTNATVQYKPDGTFASRSDAAGIVTTFLNYDDTHRFPRTKRVTGRTGLVYDTTVVADLWGRPLSTLDAKGVATGVQYDALGRPKDEWVQYPGTVSFPTKHYEYNDGLMGNANAQYTETTTYQDGGSPLMARAKYDGLGRTYRSETTGWQNATIVSETEYDTFGRVLRKSSPHFANETPLWARYEYDERSRAVKETTFGAGAQTITSLTETIFHSPQIVETKITGKAGEGGDITHTKTTEADAYGRLIWVKHDDMPAMKYTYDVMGALTGAWGWNNAGWQQYVALTYDAWGHKLTYQDFDAGTPTTLTEYFYDSAGRLIKQHESVSADTSTWRETNLVYGGDLYQLTSRVGTDNTGGTALSETLSYFGPGNGLNTGELKQRLDASGQYDYGRASSGGTRLVAQTSAWLAGAPANLVFREYRDRSGRTVQSQLPLGETVNWSYYPNSGLPYRVTDQAGQILAEYTDYDESHMLVWKRNNGIQTTHTLDYDTGRLTDVSSIPLAGGTARQNLHYTFWTDGQVKKVTDATPDAYTQEFTYDSAMRLKTAVSPSKYGTLTYEYDDTVPGGRLAYKGSYARVHDQPVNEQVELIYDDAFAHRVTGTSDGSSLTYDAWGNVVQEARPGGAGTLLYTYDAWNRMTGLSIRTMTSPGNPRGGIQPVYETRAVAKYIYDASGERVQTIKYIGGFASLPLYQYRHVSALGYEVEMMEDTTVKTRWAIPGPNGLVCWKQKLTAGNTFAALTAQSGYEALAGMAFENLWGDGQSLFAGGIWARLGAATELAKDAAGLARHGFGAIAANPAMPANVAWGMCLLLGLALVVIPSSRRGRKAVERLLTAEARRRRERKKRLFTGRTGRDRVWTGRDGMLLPVPLSCLSFSPLKPVFSLVPSCLGGESSSSSSFASSRLCGESSLRPLAPWTPLPFRITAKLFIFLFVVQAGMFVAPVQVHAETLVCEQTFYPLTDHLGTVNNLTDKDGNVVLSQHFLPFGEDFENPKSTVTSCNNNEPWPYGFTGQYHDAESGLIYFHARYYNPAIGHFMSADSVVPNPQDTFSYDRYGYARNNPINLIDPTGHFIILVGMLIGAIIGALTAAINGQNILVGALMGAVSGAMGGAGFLASVGVGAAMGAISAAISGGNILQGALIGAAGAAIGAGIAAAGNSAGGFLANANTWQKAAVSVLSGGTVGGLSSVAMGGDFWKGFTQGAAAAGISFAANTIAGNIANNQGAEQAGEEGTVAVGPKGNVDDSVAPENMPDSLVKSPPSHPTCAY